ncbi:hypothetical protein FCL47_23660 [Desulfopila sp. IMCC35006]|uniref:hypothetical protein n=1 Tax=Desulfopila sp. IMCC35006 TaxID=2569542 RepID=UPI0010ACDE1F|nr:hypothetical protein [Desulfopila sp. IMCC35006]TKB23154.1 hypothetical protein FCL47_23660 [Desulfopila sp. IMCC35006]
MLTCVRQFVFIFLGTVLRWPIWLMIGIAGQFKLFRFVFLVYPTDEVECRQFCPNIPILRRYLSGRPTPGGLVVDGWCPIGIYFVVPDLPRDLARKKNRQLAETIVRRMRWIRRLAGAKTIGLAGQLGPIFSKRHNIPIEPPIFSSINGNIFSIHEAINWAALKKNTFSKQIKIAIIGGGELGETLHGYLSGQGLQCDIVDVRFTRRGNVLAITSCQSEEMVKQADFVINLLPKGEDFIESNLSNIMGEKTSVIDFSRPAIDQEKLSQRIYMGNRVQRTGMRFVLALPGGWGQKELPACSLPALLAALTGEINNKVDSFCLHARKQSFTTALIADMPPRLSKLNGGGEVKGKLIAEVG